uniref:Uncharacterized protein n=1 Tax=Anguilla anguilla TaxID=7936 RepID=A0A0E9U1L5_ANGAN
MEWYGVLKTHSATVLAEYSLNVVPQVLNVGCGPISKTDMGELKTKRESYAKYALLT